MNYIKNAENMPFFSKKRQKTSYILQYNINNNTINKGYCNVIISNI